MASIYERDDSRFIWIKFRDGTGKVIQRSTGYKKDVPTEYRLARVMCAERTADEFRHGRTVRTGGQAEEWTWVPEFIQARHTGLTRRGYSVAWTTLKIFLDHAEVRSPQALTRKHCFEYIEWRKTKDGKGKFAAKHNTALSEMKVLSVVMGEAVERGLAIANPCLGLKIRRQRPKQKVEITDAECATIRTHIADVKEPALWEMLHYSFEITRFQGCRLMETQLDPLRDVSIFTRDGEKRGTITFRQKGGRDFTTVLSAKLIPLFEDLQTRGRNYTWRTPEGMTHNWAAGRWHKFFRRVVKLPHLSIHCNRVTFISELARGNVPEGKARAMVGHANSLSHRIYQRLQLDDLWEASKQVGKGVDGA